MRKDNADKSIPLVDTEVMDKLLKVMKKSWNELYLHSANVANISLKIGKCLLLDENENKLLVTGALLHDIGKMSINRDIIDKPKKLNNKEWSELKKHPCIGATIVLEKDGHSSLVEIIRYHHERWDGKGYEGLMGEQIPFCSRIIAVADSLDSMIAYRPYRVPLKIDEAIKEILQEAGLQFDPYIVNRLANKLYMQRSTYYDPALIAKLIEEERAWLNYLKYVYIHLSNPLIYAQSQWLDRLIVTFNELQECTVSGKLRSNRLSLVKE